jgi:hypothetical protein
MMEAARTSETLVNFYQTTRSYNPEDSNLHTHRRENLKSYSVQNIRHYHCLRSCVQAVSLYFGISISMSRKQRLYIYIFASQMTFLFFISISHNYEVFPYQHLLERYFNLEPKFFKGIRNPSSLTIPCDSELALSLPYIYWEQNQNINLLSQFYLQLSQSYNSQVIGLFVNHLLFTT